MAIFYIDALTFDLATSIYSDISLSTLAPDGYYSFNGFYRQQTSGVLITPTINCIPPNTIIANNDSYSSIVTQGYNGGNILSNDTLGSSGATINNVTITQISSTSPNVNINPNLGTVIVAAGSSVGTYSIIYQICEKNMPLNCDSGIVTFTVNPLPYTKCYDYDTSCLLACNPSGAVSNSYYVKVGPQSCNPPYLAIGPFTYQTIYSPDKPLIGGSQLYSNAGMTTPVSFTFMQMTTQSDKFVEINAGIVDVLSPVGSPC